MTNDNLPASAWKCLDCDLAPAASLCRKADGSHTFERLARAYLSDPDDDETLDERHRAFDCVREIVRAAPSAAVGFLIVACAQTRTLAELCLVAAGPLEDLLDDHGPEVITHLEKIAKVDPKFRLMLSGTWGRERIHPDVWARLVAAVSAGPVIDLDGRTPSAQTSAPVVTSAELVVLFTKVEPITLTMPSTKRH
jgi:hypothetical protein